MTRIVKLTGLFLVLIMVGTGCRFVHRGLKGRMENERMNKHAKVMDSRQMRGMGRGQMGPGGQFRFSGPMRGMRRNNWQGPMAGMRGGMRMGQGNQMGRGMGMGQGNQMGRGMGPMGMGQMGQGQMGPGNMIGRIPNLTDKQRKDIGDLRQKQMEEMDKFREETKAKLRSIREANRTKMMSLLTDEQKKSLESGASNTSPVAPKTK